MVLEHPTNKNVSKRKSLKKANSEKESGSYRHYNQRDCFLSPFTFKDR